MTGPTGAPPLATGELLQDRYRLRERVGEGGMARVYRARDELLGRDVAVKVFHADDVTASDRRRTLSEMRLLAGLSHPSLVTLFDAHLNDAAGAYLVMELIDGPTLRERISSGPIGGTDLAAMAVDLADALSVVHAAGIVHRDVKPSNVLLRRIRSGDRTFRATLADFGIAHLVDGARVTAAGTVMGTAAYLAPEQVRGERAQPASDVYALGLLLLEAHTGRAAFGGSTVQEMLAARLVRAPEIPGSLGYPWKSLLSAMTALRPEHRPTAREVVERASLLSAPGAATAASETGASAAAGSPTAPTRMLVPPVPPLPAALPPSDGRRRRRRMPLLLAAAGVVVVAGLALAAGAAGLGAPAPVPVATSPAADPTTDPGAANPSPEASEPAESTSATVPAEVVSVPGEPGRPGQANDGPNENKGPGKSNGGKDAGGRDAGGKGPGKNGG